MSHFECYSLGLCCASVCTDLTDREEIERITNLEYPTGIDSKWEISKDTHFHQGGPMPGPCEKDPSRTHYLMEC